MDIYWSHYAKVMEYNRQRMLLQNSNHLSLYDMPSAQLQTNHCKSVPSPFCNINDQVQILKSFSVPKRKYPYRPRKYKRKSKKKRKKSATSSEQYENKDSIERNDSITDDSSSRLEFVVDDGFMKFLEISMEHKLKRKKQLQAEKQRETLKQEEELAKGTNLMGVKHKERKSFKSSLYGAGGDKIMAMENAMDINLNQQKDLHKPVLWPNIALNLKF